MDLAIIQVWVFVESVSHGRRPAVCKIETGGAILRHVLKKVCDDLRFGKKE